MTKKDQLEDQGVDRIVLKQIYRKSGGTVCNGLIWLSLGSKIWFL